MGLLQESRNEMCRAKVGIFGPQGSGKTTTAALLAIAVSRTYHKGAPVAMLDTESGSDYLKPIFDAEGVKLLVAKSGAFADMCTVLEEAQKQGCCCFIVDSVTHTWRELVESYCARKAESLRKTSYSPQFQDWAQIKYEWSRWTRAFLNSQLHCFVAGRAGYEYQYQDVEGSNRKELIKGDSKLKAENEFGYEPSLLIEMVTERRETNQKHRGGSFVHVAYVLKDRTRSLNGKHFEFADLNSYKAGDWKKVFKSFEPHFAFLNIGGTQHALGGNTSEDLFDDNGDGEARQRSQSRNIALEEIQNVMGVVLWPGATAEVKKIKLAVLQTLFGVRAWTAVEGMSLKKIEDGLFALHEYERAARDAQPNGEQETLALLAQCTAKVAQAGYTPGQAEEPLDDDEEADFEEAMERERRHERTD